LYYLDPGEKRTGKIMTTHLITVTETINGKESVRIIEVTSEAQAISLTAALNCKGKVFKNASWSKLQ
jgi:hypothetical protein